MDYTYLRTSKKRYCITFYDNWFRRKIVRMSTGVHFGCMQIKKIAQSCRLGNKAEFVLGRHMNATQQQKLHRIEHF